MIIFFFTWLVNSSAEASVGFADRPAPTRCRLNHIFDSKLWPAWSVSKYIVSASDLLKLEGNPWDPRIILKIIKITILYIIIRIFKMIYFNYFFIDIHNFYYFYKKIICLNHFFILRIDGYPQFKFDQPSPHEIYLIRTHTLSTYFLNLLTRIRTCTTVDQMGRSP